MDNRTDLESLSDHSVRVQSILYLPFHGESRYLLGKMRLKD